MILAHQWAGAKGSTAYYRGEFSADDQALSGDWAYPGGGGYSSTMSRARNLSVTIARPF
jgi:hypothetical protein